MLRTALLDDSNTTADMATNTKVEMPGGDNGQDKRSKSRGQSVVDGVRRMYDELVAHNRAFRAAGCTPHTPQCSLVLCWFSPPHRYALAFGQRKGDGSEEDGDWTPYEVFAWQHHQWGRTLQQRKMVTWCLTVLWVCCALPFPSTLTFARSGQRTGYELDGACCTHSSSVFAPAGISPLARSSLSWLLLVRRSARLVEGERRHTHTQQLTLLCF